jgi:3-dehydroquinate dehydratase
LATTTILSDGLVSCIPCPELTTVLVVPESNIASVIASSIALALSWLDARSTFQRSSRRAHRCADVAMGLGLASVTGRASLL